MKQILVLRPANGSPKWVPVFVHEIVEFIKTGALLLQVLACSFLIVRIKLERIIHQFGVSEASSGRIEADLLAR